MSLLHIGIAYRSVDQDLPERRQKRERFLRRVDFRLRHDLHQRYAGTIEVDSRAVLKVEALGHVFLEMNAHEMHFLVGRSDIFLCVLRVSQIVQWDGAVGAKRHVVLRDLIVLRHVRIEIVFAIELADGCNVASEHESSQHRHAQRLLIHHWQCARQTKTNRAGVRVRFRSELNRRSTKHLRARVKLDVHFQTDGGEILHADTRI